jgi:galactose mutarotase-like enzyme
MYMVHVKDYKLGNYQIFELTDTASNSWIKVAPERGGIIISLGLMGEELLFLNEETFLNEEANVRGGIPILFPICGQLQNGEYELDGQVYKMKNHGVARNHPWRVVRTSTEGKLSITIALDSNEETRKSYPFDFQLVFTYVLEKNKLSIQQEYINKSSAPMPMYAGFHPYFETSVKKFNFETDAQSYQDYNDMKIKKYDGVVDLNHKKESFTLLESKVNKVAFDLPEKQRRVSIDYDSIFRYVVLWSEEGQNFICVEPWMAKTNELNENKEVVYVQPGESLKTVMSITGDLL